MEDDFIAFEQSAPQANSLTAPEVKAQERMRNLSTAYKAFVTGKAGKAEVQTVMDDLVKFGRLYETTVAPNGGALNWPMEVYEGRRQVVLRILEYSRLSPGELFNRYHNKG